MTEALHALEFWLSSSPSHYLKIQDGLALWYRLIHVILEIGPLNWQSVSCFAEDICRFVNHIVGNSVVNWQWMVDIYKNYVNEGND